MYSSRGNNNNNMRVANDQTEESTNQKRIFQIVVDLIIIVIVFAIFAIVWGAVDPKIRYLTCDQSDVFYPYLPDTIPFWAAGLFGALGPIILIPIIELINANLIPFQKNKKNLTLAQRRRKFLICLFHGLSLFVLGLAITLCLTEIGKKWVGRLRPYFIDICKPNFNTIDCTLPAKTGAYYPSFSTGGSFCTGDAKDVKEARLSFPSGHSSFTCYCMLFLIIFIEARLFLLRLRYIKPLIQMAAFIAAFVTSLSRVSDYHHRGSDVVGGMVLGIIVAIFITFFSGRVLWEYEADRQYADFDLKPGRSNTNDVYHI